MQRVGCRNRAQEAPPNPTAPDSLVGEREILLSTTSTGKYGSSFLQPPDDPLFLLLIELKESRRQQRRRHHAPNGLSGPDLTDLAPLSIREGTYCKEKAAPVGRVRVGK